MPHDCNPQERENMEARKTETTESQQIAALEKAVDVVLPMCPDFREFTPAECEKMGISPWTLSEKTEKEILEIERSIVR